ncbi:MAG: YkgJ family cysteine cluster protein [Lachnospiraceae bacterium]|nr:YkgJ family cysteine cluster protein [Lachnospiraceae bacterium]
MIKPGEVKFQSKKKENENLAFRTFLKIHADEEKLDEQFLRLHNELFQNYDCNRCRNCCKLYTGSIPKEDLEQDADKLGMSVDDFKEQYLKAELDAEGNYATLHIPCDFMDESRGCILGVCKPDSCKKYPYTNQPERLQSLFSILDAVGVCPVAFEIWERLKIEYGFRYRR